MKNNHTHGPWWFFKVSTFSDDFYLLEGKDSETGNDIDIASWRWILDSDEECREIANLIAAAPDLLNALEGAAKALRSGNGVKQLKAAENARAAIAKAKLLPRPKEQ